MKNKRFLFSSFVLFAFFVVNVCALAQTGSQGTGGFLTSSQSVYIGPCALTQLKVKTDGTNNATVTLYDSASGSGEVVTSWTCPGPGANAATNFCVEDWPWPNREIKNGLYVTITGTGASFIVEYRKR